MHVAINCSSTANSHGQRGIGVYSKLLIESLQKYEYKHSYTLFTHTRDIPKNVDIVHYPFFDPFFLTLPIIKPKPTVVTIHDVIPLVFPEHFTPGVRGTVKWYIQKMSVKAAARIITDSENSKRDICRIIGIDESYIDVVPLAPKPIYIQSDSGKPTIRITNKYNIQSPYFLYVGDVNWNKNILNLLRAFALLVKQHVEILSLVLIGKAFVDKQIPQTREVIEEIHALHLEDRVFMPGFVPDEDLVELYKQAEALVLPSHYEGFGFPIVEAFAGGCLVVATNTSSLSEIIGPAFQVTEDEGGIVKGLQAVLSMTKTERKKRIEAGLHFSRKFSWQRVAQETVASYEKVLE